MNRVALRGILFLGIGLFAIVTFLFGGGVVSSADGSYWTQLFVGAFVVGLVCPGILVYRSSRGVLSKRQPSMPKAVLVGGVGLLAIFSIAFVLTAGQHAFVLFMGLSLAQLVALGIGFVSGSSKIGLDPSEKSQ